MGLTGHDLLIFSFLMFIFEREREREHAQVEEGQREKEREKERERIEAGSALTAVSPMQGWNSQIVRS